MDIRKIDLVSLGIIIFLMVTAYLTLFKTDRTKIATLKEQEKRLTEKLDLAGDMSVAMDKISLEIEKIQRNLEAFNQQLPSQKRIHDFIRSIDKLADQNGVQLEAIDPGEMQRASLYTRIPIKIAARSGFQSFYEFLYQLEKIPRITRMERLRIDRPADQDRCHIELALAVFIGGD